MTYLVARQGNRRLLTDRLDPDGEAILVDEAKGTRVKTGISVGAMLSRGYWKLADTTDIQKHYPGGKDHDQMNHGRRGSGGTSGPAGLRPASDFDGWHDKIRSDLTERGYISKLNTGRSTVCSQCGLPAWEIPVSERGRYGNPAGEMYTHIGTASGPMWFDEDGRLKHDTVVLYQGDEMGVTYMEPVDTVDGMRFSRIIDHRPPELIQVPEEIEAFWRELQEQQNAMTTEYNRRWDENRKAERAEQKAAYEAKEAERKERLAMKQETQDEQLLKPIILKGREVRMDVEAALEGAEQVRAEATSELWALRDARKPENARAIGARGSLYETATLISKFEANRYPGVSSDDVMRVLDSADAGDTIRERLETWRAIQTGEAAAATEVRVKGTDFQYAEFQDLLLSGSEQTAELQTAGVEYDEKKNQWVFPDRRSGELLRNWADTRAAYGYTVGERRSFKGMREKIQTSLDTTTFEGDPISTARETYWAISGTPEGGRMGRTLYEDTSPVELMRNDWLKTASFDPEAFYAWEAFRSDKAPWTDKFNRTFLGEERALVSGRQVYSSADIVDSLLVQADFFDAHASQAQQAVDEIDARYDAVGDQRKHVQAGIVKDVLSQHREFGDTPVSTKGHTGRSAMIKDLSTLYPSDWIAESRAQAKETGKKIVMSDKTRGDYSHYNRRIRLPEGDNWRIEDVVIHELGHHFEHTVQSVSDAEGAFYRIRTKDSPPQKLKTLVPQSKYEPHETSRPDKFTDPYMGRDYDTGSYELLSMGTPRVYGYVSGAKWNSEDKPFGMDPEMADFIFGLLVEG